jgi:hypothetical protein
MIRTLPPRVVVGVDAAVVIGLTAAGLFASQGWRAWYGALVESFAIIATPVLGGAAVVTWVSERQVGRLQGARRGSALVGPGSARHGARRVGRGLPVRVAARADERRAADRPGVDGRGGGRPGRAGPAEPGRPARARRVAVLEAQAAPHAPALRLPPRSPRLPRPDAAGRLRGRPRRVAAHVLAGAARRPPRGAPLRPGLPHARGGFVLLNLYLHCGVAWRGLETLLRPLSINTSTHHNRHHANADTHFAEALTVWDRLLGTREAAAARRA